MKNRIAVFFGMNMKRLLFNIAWRCSRSRRIDRDMIKASCFLRTNEFKLILPYLVIQNVIAAARFYGARLAERLFNFGQTDLTESRAFIRSRSKIPDIVHDLAAADAKGIRTPSRPGRIRIVCVGIVRLPRAIWIAPELMDHIDGRFARDKVRPLNFSFLG